MTSNRLAADSSSQCVEEPLFYEDGKDWRIVDLRPHGVDCIPLFAFGKFRAARPGVGMHVHTGYVEISMCVRGNLQYETDGIIYPVLPGHVFISRPSEPHRRCDNPKGMVLYRMLLALPPRGRRILSLTPGESALIAQAILHSPHRLFHATKRLRTAFVRLSAGFAAAAGGTDGALALHRLEMRNAALELLLALVEAPNAPHRAKGYSAAKVKDLAQMIAEHPEASYPVADMAKEAGLSHFAFSEAFKRETGTTPHSYILDQRVRRAKDDLARGRDASISAVAAKWSFSSPQHMATAFRRILGKSPRQVARR